MFFNKGFACFHLHWVEGIDLGDLWSEVRAEFNGMVIGTMRGELVMGLLREDVLEVLAPVKYDRFSQLGGLNDLGGDGGFVDLFPL